MHIKEAAFAFLTNGVPITWQAYGQGHINQTLKVTTDTGAEYILQRINQYVFQNPKQLMENVGSVTAFLRKKDPDPRHSLHFLSTAAGLDYFVDSDGEYWRMYEFVDGVSLDVPETETDLYQSGLAFGRFQMLLSDFPAQQLHETIPEFHNTIDRYRLLRQSVDKDACGRLKDVQPELAFLLQHEQLGCTLQRMREEGRLPLRVTHNDTKLNNVLLDAHTRQGLCVLDLDTVMPGLSLYDFGDSIRFGASTGGEGGNDNLLDLHLFRVYTQGFLAAATNLTETEIEMLPLSAFVITLELATRFLKDHLDGDLYFKTTYPGQNLDRARSQICLAADMLRKQADMARIVSEIRCCV